MFLFQRFTIPQTKVEDSIVTPCLALPHLIHHHLKKAKQYRGKKKNLCIQLMNHCLQIYI